MKHKPLQPHEYKEPSLFLSMVAAFGIYLAAYCAIFGTLGAICFPYAINAWLAYLGKDPSFTYLGGALLGIVPFAGQCAIPAAVITFVAMLFL